MPLPIDLLIKPVNQGTTTVALGQTLGAAGNMTLSGALAGGPYDASSITRSYAGSSSVKIARQITLTCVGNNESGVTFTITGTDENGNAQTETVIGPSSGTVTSVKFYNTVTSIAANAAVSNSTSAGTNGVWVTSMIPLQFYKFAPYTVDLDCTGTITLTCQEGFENVYQGETPIYQNMPNLTNLVVTSGVPAGINAQGNPNSMAFRLKSISYTNGATVRLILIQPRTLGGD